MVGIGILSSPAIWAAFYSIRDIEAPVPVCLDQQLLVNRFRINIDMGQIRLNAAAAANLIIFFKPQFNYNLIHITLWGSQQIHEHIA